MTNPVRLGIVSYLAARPCVEGLDADSRFIVTKDAPAVLVDLLRRGELDCALVSSIEAFRAPGYRYVPGIGIASEREVRSVLLISTKEISEIRSVALDPASRAGAALSRICLRELASPAVQFVDGAFGRELEFYKTDAWVRIGDAALVESWKIMNNPDSGLFIYDLAALWRRQTGLPFVFALWLVRPRADWTPEHTRALREARMRGVAARRELAAEASRKLNIAEDYLYSYLEDYCSYDLTRPGMIEALGEFQRRASALGLADNRYLLQPVPES